VDVEFKDGQFRAWSARTRRSASSMSPGSVRSSWPPHGQVRCRCNQSGQLQSQSPRRHPNGSHVCELEVDPETERCGWSTAIFAWSMISDAWLNPYRRGQIHGGVVKGSARRSWSIRSMIDIRAALSGSLMDYSMPRADHHVTEIGPQLEEILQDYPALG